MAGFNIQQLLAMAEDEDKLYQLAESPINPMKLMQFHTTQGFGAGGFQVPPSTGLQPPPGGLGAPAPSQGLQPPQANPGVIGGTPAQAGQAGLTVPMQTGQAPVGEPAPGVDWGGVFGAGASAMQDLTPPVQTPPSPQHLRYGSGASPVPVAPMLPQVEERRQPSIGELLASMRT